MPDRRRVDPDSPPPPDSVQVTVSLRDLGLTGKIKITDLWSGEHIGNFKGDFTRWIRRHGCGFYRLEK